MQKKLRTAGNPYALCENQGPLSFYGKLKLWISEDIPNSAAISFFAIVTTTEEKRRSTVLQD